MNEDHELLRQTMSDLAEHGGNTDLYDRTLRASRRLGRNRWIATISGLAAAILVIAAPIAVANVKRAAPPAIVAVTPTITTPVPTQPVTSAPSVPPSSPTGETSTGTAKGNSSGCPVTAAKLDKARTARSGGTMENPIAEIECHSGYATGRYFSDSADTETAIFQYSANNEKWKWLGSGSAGFCESLLPRAMWDKFSVCDYLDPDVGCPLGQLETAAAVSDSEYADLRGSAKYFDIASCEGRDALARVGTLQPTAFFILKWTQSTHTWKVVDGGECKAGDKSRNCAF